MRLQCRPHWNNRCPRQHPQRQRWRLWADKHRGRAAIRTRAVQATGQSHRQPLGRGTERRVAGHLLLLLQSVSDEGVHLSQCAGSRSAAGRCSAGRGRRTRGPAATHPQHDKEEGGQADKPDRYRHWVLRSVEEWSGTSGHPVTSKTTCTTAPTATMSRYLDEADVTLHAPELSDDGGGLLLDSEDRGFAADARLDEVVHAHVGHTRVRLAQRCGRAMRTECAAVRTPSGLHARACRSHASQNRRQQHSK